MQQELKLTELEPKWVQWSPDLLEIDVMGLSAPSFNLFSWRLVDDTFLTLLIEIEQIMDNKQLESKWEYLKDEKEIKWLLPKEYKNLADVFLKCESDKMPPSQPNNYKIQLELDANLQKTIGHSPLYKMLAE